MRPFIGLEVHKAYVYGYELRGQETAGLSWANCGAPLDGNAHAALKVTGNTNRCCETSFAPMPTMSCW